MFGQNITVEFIMRLKLFIVQIPFNIDYNNNNNKIFKIFNIFKFFTHISF